MVLREGWHAPNRLGKAPARWEAPTQKENGKKKIFPQRPLLTHVPAGLGAVPVPLKYTLVYPLPNEPPFPRQLQGSLSGINWVWITELLPPRTFYDGLTHLKPRGRAEENHPPQKKLMEKFSTEEIP